MRFAKSVAATTIILAATSLGGHNVYADDISPVEEASTATTTQTEQPKKPVIIEITVGQGDNLTEIAKANDTTVDDIIADNNIADPDTIEPGQVLKVTKSDQKLSDFYGSLKAAAEAFMEPPVEQPVAATAVSAPTYAVAATVRDASAPKYQAGSSAGNTYVWGTCTWYVKNRKPNIPNMLGNGGYGWLQTAAAAGYATGSTPRAGAIGVQAGHVVIVESVHGSRVSISEMNYAGGVGVVHYRTVPASTFKYIYA